MPNNLRSLLFVIAILVPLKPSIVLAQDADADSNELSNGGKSVNIEISGSWDWLQLTSGEWLKGELQSMDNFVVYFDSDKLKDLEIKWEDVQAVETSRPMAVLMRNYSTAVGPITTENGQLLIKSQNISIAFDQVVSIATGTKERADLWVADIAVSSNFRRGNTEEKDVTISATGVRRTAKSSFRFSYVANFSEFNGEENSNDHRFNGSYDYRISSDWFWRPVLMEYYSDTFQNIQSQWTVGAGAGYYIIEDYDLNWVVSAGPAYQITDYENTPVDSEDPVKSGSIFMSTQYDQEVTDDIDWRFSYQVILTHKEAGKAKHSFVTGLDFDLTDNLSFSTNFYWDRIANPQVDEDGIVPEKNDYRLTFGLKYDL